MLTRTSEYALRAMSYLERHVKTGPVSTRKIAHDVGISPAYLGQALGKLVRAGVLVASPGTGGGFRLARPGKDISLMEVIAPFEAAIPNRKRCPFGNKECDRDDPCTGHMAWTKVGDAYYTFLVNTSVADIGLAPPQRESEKKRRR